MKNEKQSSSKGKKTTAGKKQNENIKKKGSGIADTPNSATDNVRSRTSASRLPHDGTIVSYEDES